VNKLIKAGVVCDLFGTYTCDLLTPAGMYQLDNKEKYGEAQL
jgi:hypothetical protein